MSNPVFKDLEQTLRTLVLSIIDSQDLLEVETQEVDSGVSFEVKVGAEDVGKIIGKGGRIASSIRTVMKAAGAKLSTKVMVSISNKPAGD
jgi:predicted RNA-binding protein YlqC (UPF0109 family)